jgi:hypothetical protein
MSNDEKQDPGKGDNLVSIIIEKKEYKSPNPTTGAALYTLGQVPTGYELFREVHGKGDDEPIANNATPVQLKPGDHFYFAQSSLNPGNHRVR